MPHKDLNTLLEFEISVEKANPHCTKNVIICGDFNCQDINGKFGLTYEHAQNKQVQDKLIDIINENSFEQLQEKNTRENSLLDLTLATYPSLVRNLNNVPGIGDHEAIIFDSFVKPVF